MFAKLKNNPSLYVMYMIVQVVIDQPLCKHTIIALNKIVTHSPRTAGSQHFRAQWDTNHLYNYKLLKSVLLSSKFVYNL